MSISDFPLCHCGRPLHYTDADKRRQIERMIDLAGGDQYVTVTVGERAWRVQRHYLALHGLSAVELLSGVTGFDEITDYRDDADGEQ